MKMIIALLLLGLNLNASEIVIHYNYYPAPHTHGHFYYVAPDRGWVILHETHDGDYEMESGGGGVLNTVFFTGSYIIMDWPAEPNFLYQVEESSDLVTWRPLSVYLETKDGWLRLVVPTTQTARKFYRIIRKTGP